MFAAIYYFEVKKTLEDDLILAWEEMTKFITEYEGGLGSVLHKQKDGTFIAYAQWPNKAAWENAGGNMTPEAKGIRKRMKAYCLRSKTIHELDIISDLLKR